MTMQTPGSLKSLMDGLVQAQAGVVTHPLLASLDMLHPYRWRPDSPDFPAMWNWLLPGSHEQRDTHRQRDVIVVETRIGSRFTDAEQRLGAVELYFDAYRDVVDPIFRPRLNTVPNPPVVFGDATWAERTSAAMFSEDFGGAVALGVSFVQTFYLDRGV